MFMIKLIGRTPRTLGERIQMTFYGPKDVCIKLNIGESTLRKWAGYLIRLGGYQFVVDQYGHRSYSDRDIAVLKRLQGLLSQKYTYEDAIREVCKPENAENTNNAENAENPHDISVLPITRVLSATGVLGEEVYKEMVIALQEQSNLNKKLVERLERLEERTEERDRALTQVLRQVLDVRTELAAEREKKKKSWWPWGR